MENKKSYGLSTATAMIIGVVVGSGIFFKIDDVLGFTGGNIGLGILVLCIGALSIIFGSLALTELSIRTKKSGGAVGYYEDFISKKIASGFGWFQTFVYYPSINAVVAWVSIIYLGSLFGFNLSLELQIIFAFILVTIIFAMNMLSKTLGGYFQNLTTIIKLVPLLIVAIVGIFWTGSTPSIPADVVSVPVTDVGIGWLAALAPIAFSYDGWIIATSITGEVKNPKKNMTLALIIGPLAVLGIYLLYFIGMTKILGAEYILSTGNDALNKVGEMIFGPNGSAILLIGVIIAIIGVVNGITLGSIRMPQALASKRMLPYSEQIEKVNEKMGVSIPSCIISYVTVGLWLFLHYITQKTNILKGGDVSEIAIVFSYVCYFVLYVKVINMKIQGKINSIFKGVICPLLGCLGSTVILFGGLLSNLLYVSIFIVFCFLICALGVLYYTKNKDRK